VKEKVLLVVDVQKDFCDGSLSCHGAGNIIEPINRLINGSRWDLVVMTQEWHPRNHCSFASSYTAVDPFTVPDDGYKGMVWPDHCIAGTEGAEIHPGIDQSRVNMIVRKGLNVDVDSYSAFSDKDGVNPTVLRDIFFTTTADIYVCGIATETCVKNTVMDAMMPYTTVHVIQDACAGMTEEGHRTALMEMEKEGIYIVTVEDVVQ